MAANSIVGRRIVGTNQHPNRNCGSPKSRKLKAHGLLALSAAAGVAAVFGGNSAKATPFTRANNTNTLNTPGAWTANSGVPGSGDIALFNNTITTTADATATLGDSSQVWGEISVVNPVAGIVIGVPATLNDLSFQLIGVGGVGIDMSSATANLTIDSSLVVGGAQSWNVQTARTFTLAGTLNQGANLVSTTGAGADVISGVITGSGGFTLGGTGAVTLSGANAATYTGNTTLTSGTLNIGNAGALGTGGNFIINGGTFNNTSGASTTLTGNNAQQWNGSFIYTGTNSLNLGSGAVTLGSAALTATISAATLEVDGAITGGGAVLTKAGNGTLFLNNAANSNFTTTLTAGNVAIAADADLPGGVASLTWNGGGLQFNGYNTTAFVFNNLNGSTTTGGLRLGGGPAGSSGGINANQITGTSAPIFQGQGTLHINGASGVSGYSGVTTFATGITEFSLETSLYNNVQSNWTAANLIVNSGATAAFNVGGGEFTPTDIQTILSIGGTASTGFENGSIIGLDTTNAGGNVTYGNVISNANAGANVLNLTVLGGASTSLTLSAANTYSGATNANSGTLILGNALALQNSTLTVNGGTVSFGSLTSATLGGLTGAGDLSAGTTNINFGGNNATATYSGILSSTADVTITKNGTGTETLSGPNTFTGTTVVNAGGLTLTATQANTAFVVNSSGTLTVNAAQAATATFTLNGGTLAGNQGLAATNIINVNSGTSTISMQGASNTLSALFAGNGALNWNEAIVSNVTLNMFAGYGGTVSWGSDANGLRMVGATGGGTSLNPFANFDLGTAAGNIGARNGTVQILLGGLQASGTTATIGGSSNTGGHDVFMVVGSANLSQSFAGVIVQGTTNTEFSKTGPGTLTLTGLSTANATDNDAAPATYNVAGGTLLLNYSTNVTNILAAAGSFGLAQGGTLSILGHSTGTTAQTFIGTVVSSGGGTLIVNPNGGTTNLALGTMTVNTNANAFAGAGSALNIQPPNATISGIANITTTTPKLALDGSYGARFTYGSDWVTSSGAGPFALAGYTAYNTLSSGFAGGSDTTDDQISSTTGSLTLTGAYTTNALKVNPGSGQQLDLGGQTLSVTNGGLLFAGSNNYTIGVTAGSTIKSLSSTTVPDLVIQQLGTGNLTIGASIVNGVAGATANGASTLTKAGPGTLTLTADNGYTGITFIDGGILSVGADNNIGGNNGTIAIATSTTSSATVTLSSATVPLGFGPGSNLLGRTVNSVNGVTVTLNGNAGTALTGGQTAAWITGNTVNIDGGTLQATNSFTMTESNAGGSAGTVSGNRSISLGGTGGTFDVTSTNNLTVPGVISDLTAAGSGSTVATTSMYGPLIKTDSGTLTLTGANNYVGATIISGGIISTNLLANGGVASGIGISQNVAPALVLNGGTLQYTGAAVSTDRAFTVTPAGGTIDGSGTGALTFSNTAPIGVNVLQAGSGARTLTLTNTLAQANGVTNVFAGQIVDGSGGATSLTKAGAGSWSLTAASHTYTGNTNLTGGTLFLSNSSSTNSISTSANINVGSGTVLDVTGLANSTIALGTQNLTGSGSVNGAVTAGPTSTISPGIAQVGSLTLNSNLSVSSGTTLNFGLSDANLDGALTASADLINVTSLLTLPSSGIMVQLFTPGTANQFINVPTGGNETFDLVHYGSYTGPTVTNANFNLTNANGAFTYTFSDTGSTNGYITVNVASTGVASSWNDTSTLPNPGLWSNSANWTGSLVPGTGNGGTGVGDSATFGSNTAVVTNVSLDSNISTGGTTTLGSITFTGSANYTISGSNTLTLNNGATAAPTIHDQGGNQSINVPIVLPQTLASLATVITVDNSGDTVTLGGLVSGTGSITKAGPGTLVLSNTTNTYGTGTSGGTNINGGTLKFDAIGELGSGTNISFGGGTLQYNGNSDDITATDTVTLNTGGGTIDTNGSNVILANAHAAIGGVGALTKAGAGTLTFPAGAVNTYTGNTIISGGTVNFSALTNLGAGTGITINNGATLQWATSTATDISARAVTIGAGGGTLDLNGNTLNFASGIGNGGAGALTLTSSTPAAITLTHPSTYTGGTTINNVQVTTTDPTTFNGGSFGSGTINFLGTAGSIVSAFTASGDRLNLPTINLASGAAGTVTSSASAGTAIILNGLTGSGTLNAVSAIAPATGSSSSTGILFGGAGYSTFTGTLNISSNSAANNAAVIYFNTSGGATSFNGNMSGTTVNLTNNIRVSATDNTNGNTWTVGALSGDSTAILAGSDFGGGGSVAGINNANAAGFTVAVGGRGTNTVFAGKIVDGATAPLSITKQGNGIFTISGSANTQTGWVQINAGTLNLMNTANTSGISGENTSSATGYGVVNVNNTGTLSGTGFETDDNSSVGVPKALVGFTNPIAAVVTVASGGHIDPGDATAAGAARIGTLSLGNVVLNSGSILDFELASTSSGDLLNVTNPSSSTTGLTINGGLVNLFQPGTTTPFTTPGTYDLIQLDAPSDFQGSLSNLSFPIVPNTTYTSGTSGNFITVTIGNIPSVFWANNSAGGGNWGNTSGSGPNWIGGSAPNQAGATASFDDTHATFSSAQVVTLDGNKTVGTINFNSTQSFTIQPSSGSQLILNNNAAPAIIADTKGTHTISAPMDFSATGSSGLSVSVTNSTDALTLSGSLTGTGPLALNSPTGAGKITLSGNNSAMTGTTTLAGGTLVLGHANALAGSTLVLSGGALNFAPGVGTFNVAQLTAGSITLQDTAATPGPVTLALGGTGASFTYSGVLSGPGGFTKNGAGTVTLQTGINNYAGNTTINNGTLAVNALEGNTGNVTVGDGSNLTTLILNSGGNIGGTITLNNNAVLQMAALGTGASPSVFPSNSITIPAGAVAELLSLGAGDVYSGAVSSGTPGDTTARLYVGPNLSMGTTPQFQNFTGTVDLGTLGGNIRWFAQTGGTVNGGPNTTFDLGSAGTMSTRNTGTIDLGILLGQNGSALNGGTVAPGAATWRIGAGAPNATFVDQYDGAINDGSDAVATRVTKTGSGILLLTSNLAYTGNTTVNNGTLSISGSLSTGTVTIGGTAVVAGALSGPLLNGTGTIGGPIVVSGTTPAGHLAGGTSGSIGTLNTAAVTFNPGGNLDVLITDPNSSLVNVGGLLTLPTGTSGTTPGTITVNVDPSSTVVLNTQYEIFSFGSINQFDMSGDQFVGGTMPAGDALGPITEVGNAIFLSIVTGPTNASSFWTGSANPDHNWFTSGNWNGGIIPGVTTGTTNTDTATFNGAGSGNTTVTVDSGRNVDNITFDTASAAAYTIGGSALTLTSGGAITVTSTVVNPQIINAPLIVQGNYSVANNSSTPAASLTLGGTITSGVTGTSTLTLSGTSTGSNTVTGAIQDSGANHLALTTSGSWILSGTNTYTGNTNVSQGTLTLAATGSIANSANVNVGVVAGTIGTLSVLGPTSATVLTQTMGTLNVNNGAVNLAAVPLGTAHVGTHTVLSVSGLAVTPTGKIDLTDNVMVVTGTSGTVATNLTNVATYLKSGLNSASHGYWNGTTGIVSSTAATGDSRYLSTIGYRQGTGSASFEGTTPGANDVIVAYTYYGDADLNGQVDGGDYTQIDNGFSMHRTGWSNGDFNYDGVVDGTDFALIDNAYNQLTAMGKIATPLALAAPSDLVASPSSLIASPADISAVPEPTTLGLLGIGAIGLMGRRRRRNI